MEKKTSGYYREECNKIAWIYDPAASLISAIFGGEKRLRERILKLADIKSGDKVLDIGCGTGTSALIIAKDVGDEGEVVGIDLSSRMLDIARKKLKRSGFRNVTFLQANAEDIPYPDSYFDKAQYLVLRMNRRTGYIERDLQATWLNGKAQSWCDPSERIEGCFTDFC